MPLRNGRGEREESCAVIVAKYVNPMSEVGQLRARLEALAPHSTTALFNALEYRKIPLRGPLSLPPAG